MGLPTEISFSHIALGSSLALKNNPHKKYPGENINALVNGIGGTINYRDPSWQGYEAEDLIATVDLGEVRNINSVKVRFLQDQVVWIFLPKKVQIEHSVNGKNMKLFMNPIRIIVLAMIKIYLNTVQSCIIKNHGTFVLKD